MVQDAKHLSNGMGLRGAWPPDRIKSGRVLAGNASRVVSNDALLLIQFGKERVSVRDDVVEG